MRFILHRSLSWTVWDGKLLISRILTRSVCVLPYPSMMFLRFLPIMLWQSFFYCIVEFTHSSFTKRNLKVLENLSSFLEVKAKFNQGYIPGLIEKVRMCFLPLIGLVKYPWVFLSSKHNYRKTNYTLDLKMLLIIIWSSFMGPIISSIHNQMQFLMNFYEKINVFVLGVQNQKTLQLVQATSLF